MRRRRHVVVRGMHRMIKLWVMMRGRMGMHSRMIRLRMMMRGMHRVTKLWVSRGMRVRMRIMIPRMTELWVMMRRRRGMHRMTELWMMRRMLISMVDWRRVHMMMWRRMMPMWMWRRMERSVRRRRHFFNFIFQLLFNIIFLLRQHLNL
jgi:hypothetical protein